AGFVDEVRGLRARGDLDATLPSMRAVGYRQAWAALDEANGGAIDVEALAARATVATRQLAKRQLTWLRALATRVVVAADDDDAVAQTVRIAEHLFDEARVG
ncbi:MAG: tRNA (adenosine(37)-N6)-dimethylallyltransferase MiaA, partial [Rhizobacter sp.]|nr:tRNA (adenosine(37)-N6)-dimethylallyltransferase MiaA [Rhizobacter sp.]